MAAGDVLPPQDKLPSMRTRRLVLRAMQFSDATDYFAYAKDPEVLRDTVGTTPKSLRDAVAFLRGALTDPNARMWAVQLRDRPMVIGAVELGVFSPESASIHFVLGKAHWRQGLMTEAVNGVCAWAFANVPTLQEIKTSAVESNVASTRVLEKTGFERVGAVAEQRGTEPEPVQLGLFRRARQEKLG